MTSWSRAAYFQSTLLKFLSSDNSKYGKTKIFGKMGQTRQFCLFLPDFCVIFATLCSFLTYLSSDSGRNKAIWVVCFELPYSKSPLYSTKMKINYESKVILRAWSSFQIPHCSGRPHSKPYSQLILSIWFPNSPSQNLSTQTIISGQLISANQLHHWVVNFDRLCG